MLLPYWSNSNEKKLPHMSLRVADALSAATLAPYASAVSNLNLIVDCFGQKQERPRNDMVSLVFKDTK